MAPTKRPAAGVTSKIAGKADAPIEAYFSEAAPEKRILLERLRTLVAKAVPDATVSIKWRVPVYAKGGRNVCALPTFKDYVAINIFAAPETLALSARPRSDERCADSGRWRSSP